MQVSMFHCPFLGTNLDPLSSYDHAAADASCYSAPGQSHVPGLEHQEQFCLTGGFLQCQRYIEAQQVRLDGKSGTPMILSRYRTGRPRILLSTWLMLGGAALMALVALATLVFLAFRFAPAVVGELKPRVPLMALTVVFTHTPTPAEGIVPATPPLVPTATLPLIRAISPTMALSPGPTQQPTVSSPTATVALAYHVVQRGETLSMIARLYGVSVDDLARLNNIVDRDNILVGQRLLLPSYASTPAQTFTPTNTATLTRTPTFTSAPATVTSTSTVTPSPTLTYTSVPSCNRDEAMSFSPGAPASGDAVIISVTSAKTHTDVKLARGTESMGAPFEVVQGGKGWVWRWRVQNVTVARYDFNFWVGNSPVCTTNGFTVTQ